MKLAGELGAYLNQAVMAAGIVIAIVRWRHNPWTARLVVIALALPLAVTLALPLDLPFVSQWVGRMTDFQRSLLFCLDSALWQTARAAAYVLLLIVCFSPRGGPQRVPGHGGDGMEGTRR